MTLKPTILLISTLLTCINLYAQVDSLNSKINAHDVEYILIEEDTIRSGMTKEEVETLFGKGRKRKYQFGLCVTGMNKSAYTFEYFDYKKIGVKAYYGNNKQINKKDTLTKLIFISNKHQCPNGFSLDSKRYEIIQKLGNPDSQSNDEFSNFMSYGNVTYKFAISKPGQSENENVVEIIIDFNTYPCN